MRIDAATIVVKSRARKHVHRLPPLPPFLCKCSFHDGYVGVGPRRIRDGKILGSTWRAIETENGCHFIRNIHAQQFVRTTRYQLNEVTHNRVPFPCRKFGRLFSARKPKKRLEKSLQYITPYGVMCVMDQLSNVLSAISHPTRRAIIGQLANGPARFLDVAKPFDTALNAVTKHLKSLERAGLIERRKQGREVYISFRGEPLREVAGWVHEYERFWNERLDQFEQYFKDKKKEKK